MSADSLFTILIALEADHLILPNVAVAEVMGVDGLQPREDAPAWFMGMLMREGVAVPLIDFEALNGRPSPVPRRARAVFLHTLGNTLQHPMVALLSRGYPHLVNISRTTVRPLPLRDADRDDLVLARVRIGGTDAAVPDLEAIESALVEAGMAAR